MFVHGFSEGGWWGESEKISISRSGVSCFDFALCTYVLECIVMYFPSFDKAGNGFHISMSLSVVYMG